MKTISLLTLIILFCSCKQEPEKPLRYADVDTSSNEVVHLTDPDDIYYSLDDLIAQNEGKIIYVYFWHSGVPKEFMRAVEQLENKMDPDNFVILNIGTDDIMSPFENHLNITTLKHNYLARNFPEADFYQENNFIEIPKYMIYDRAGNLIDNNAMSPDNENLEETLNVLIKN